MGNDSYVFDKAKYHDETVVEHGLPWVQAFVHTGMYLGWLVDRGLIAGDYRRGLFARLFRYRIISPISLFRMWDGCLISDMLTETGDSFSRTYFDFESGRYLQDYCELFGLADGDEYSLRFSWRAYRQLSVLLDRRFAEWEATRSGGS